ncbi:chemotaxis protein CheW [Sphingomonas sp. LB-2]|uniref:chemotaxis protein CheW n=1 Tax=Sphingomonas caeni TaxID=2984949 RepID=UPI00223291CB|nr:chemotaxis protein CheW [Sphingomonas caeni]MCW3846578.1 chemotaxis protein CheW [Sphingomonas caeni]
MKRNKASDLRTAFDRSFAEPPPGEAEPTQAYLGIRVGGKAYAVALAEIGAVVADKKIAPLPSKASELLGVAGVRGDTVPVFSLAALLGVRGGEERPRWLLLATGGRAGFAFDALDGHLDVPLAQVTPLAAPRGFIHANAVLGGGARGIVNIASLMDHLERRAGSGTPKEQ